MSNIVYCCAALAEIAGCYAFWMWLRLGHSAWWAGRAFAAYGGVYIAASLIWMWFVEGERPDLRDGLGAALCLLGAGIILYGRGR